MSHRGAAAGLLLVAFAVAGCGSSGTNVAQDPATQTPTDVSATASSATSSSAPTSETTPTRTADPATTSTTDAPAGTLITLDAPAEGAAVSGSFAVSGMANSPEANVPWRILDAKGTQVLDGAFTADGWMDKLYPYRGRVDVSSLAPGTYTFVVRIDDQADGESSMPPQKVSHTITVS